MRKSILGVLPILIACGSTTPPPATPSPKAAALPAVETTTPSATKPKGGGHAPAAPVALEEYYKIKRMPALSRSSLPLASFSSDEKLIAYASDEGGRIDVWVKPVEDDAKKPVAPKQLTHVEGFVHSFAFSPKEDILVFEADKGGDELPRLFVTDSKGTAPKEITTDLPAGRRTQFVEWAEDGKTLLYASNGRDEKAMDLVEYDLKTKKSTIVWEASGALGFGAVSRDHQKIAVFETKSDTNVNVLLVDRKQPKAPPTLLTDHQGDVRFSAETFTKDGKSLIVQSDELGEFTALFTVDLATKKRSVMLKESWDVESAHFSNTWKYLVTTTNEDGAVKTVATDPVTNKAATLPAAPGKGKYFPLAFSRSDRFLAASLSSDEAPAAIHVLDLKNNTAKAIAEPLPESLRSRTMVAGESVKIPSFDGRSVPAFLYKPSTPGPHPAIIDVHGGPTAQSRRAFSPARQYFVSKGYAVLVPNVRGSTGYGKSYTKLDNLDLGGGPLKDVVACKKWLASNAQVDANKVVVMGGSYGGYMALVAEAFTPDEFVANVDFFGVSDLKTLVESFPAYWAAEASFIYQKFGDPKNPAHAKYQHDRSPANFIDKMTRPLLVVQGDKDARVKKDQSDRIVGELKKRNVPVHYLVLENEGHGFTKTENNLRAYQLTDKFLDRYVFDDDSVSLP